MCMGDWASEKERRVEDERGGGRGRPPTKAAEPKSRPADAPRARQPPRDSCHPLRAAAHPFFLDAFLVRSSRVLLWLISTSDISSSRAPCLPCDAWPPPSGESFWTTHCCHSASSEWPSQRSSLRMVWNSLSAKRRMRAWTGQRAAVVVRGGGSGGCVRGGLGEWGSGRESQTRGVAAARLDVGEGLLLHLGHACQAELAHLEGEGAKRVTWVGGEGAGSSS